MSQSSMILPMIVKSQDANADGKLLLIDDRRESLLLLESMLIWAGYTNIQSCTSGQEGLDLVESFKPDLIIVDLMMPGMDGFEFLERVKSTMSPDLFIPILVFTADLNRDSKVKALELGASDFLTKPGDAIEIQLRVRNFLRMKKMHFELDVQNQVLETKVLERTKHLTIARHEAIEVLARACEYRDGDTGRHARRVGDLSAEIAISLGLDGDFVESLRLAAPLHDLGKIAIPDTILFKPDKLTDKEYEVMKLHADIGADLLGEKTSPLLLLAGEIARYHHERWDGKGYLAGLEGEHIPLSARIVSVADTFDAITNDRPYRKRRSASEALKEIKRMSGSQFDPDVVRALEVHLQINTDEDRVAA